MNGDNDENIGGSQNSNPEDCNLEIQRLVTENLELKSRNENYEKQAKEYEQKISTLTEECARLKAENEKFKDINSCLHTTCTSLTEATIAISEKVKELNAINSKMFSEKAYQDLKNENLKLKSTIISFDCTTTELENTKKELEKTRKNYSAFQTETENLLNYLQFGPNWKSAGMGRISLLSLGNK